jgi:hypothetical protein
MEEEQQKRFVGLILDQVESHRVPAVADLLFYAESYVRALSQAIAGMSSRFADDDEAFRDV